MGEALLAHKARPPLAVLALLACVACSGRFRPLTPFAWSLRRPGLETVERSLTSGAQLFALRFDQARFTLRLSSPAGGLRVPEDIPKEAVALWNGGYFEPDLRPSGLVLDQGREVAAPSAGHGLLLIGDRFSLVRFRETPPSGLQESALQVWPFLIEPGGADGIRRDDGKRARRSAIGLDDAGRGILVGVVGDGISLYELMMVCRALGAVVAANLDGGPSTGFSLTIAPTWSVPSETSVANALVLTARSSH